MVAKRGVRTVGPMTISVAFTPLRPWIFRDQRVGHRRHPDLKIAVLGAVPNLRGLPIEELASAADLTTVAAGETLARGPAVGAQWWMPIDGWLLLSGGAAPDRTVPAGSSVGWWDATPDARLRVLRPARVLVMPRNRYLALPPRLGEALAVTVIPLREPPGLTSREPPTVTLRGSEPR